MQFIIICIIYALVLTVLGSITVKNFLNMKAKDDPLHRQYFFTALIFLIILIISFIAILLKLKRDIFIGDGSGSDIFIGYSDKTGYGLIGFIILMILGIAAIILFDRFFLKRRSKTEQEYRRRRKLAIAVAIILIGIIAVLKLIW
ncbi:MULTISPECIES: hypothetical protein [unclassified Treponema]|uniref:hypothetical protein n=1 Tax=unclassified Treponema TaxID=2638727 RepID=UPI00053011E9|nr:MULTISPECIES: hypothetical protein [unclassified Treponema]AIW89324.1 hypothetical protein JO41_05445 [Treponema sp. OMZ 838]UTC50637.1 hypothetical protein E4N65_11475 [Treponema sp. OMZ 855]